MQSRLEMIEKENILREKLNAIIKENLLELKNKKLKKSFASPLSMWFKKLWYGNHNNDNNSENKIKTSLFNIKAALKKVTNNQGDFYTNVIDLINEYNKQLYGPAALGTKLSTIHAIYITQVKAVYNCLLQNFVAFSDKEEFSLHLYQANSLEENHQLVKQAEKRYHSRWIRFLELFYSNNNIEYININSVFRDLKNLSPLSPEKYLVLLNKLSFSILQLRNNNPIDRRRANVIETLFFDIINLHCLKPMEQLSLNFTPNQLTEIIGMINKIKHPANDKIATQLSQQLTNRMQNLPNQDEPNHHKEHLSSNSSETIRIELFKNTFNRIMTAHTLALYAMSSEQIQSMPNIIGGGIGPMTVNALPPYGAFFGLFIWWKDQKITQHEAQKISKNMPPYQEWIKLVDSLSPKLANIFFMQITTMKNTKDIEQFAKFCQKQIFAAFKQGRPAWAEGLTDEEFLIAAIFKMPTKLTPIPFRTDHYHQINDSSIFANSNFQKMMGSVVFLDKTQIEAVLVDENKPSAEIADKPSSSTTAMYIGLTPIQKSKKVPATANQIKKTVQKYGMVDLSDTPPFTSKLAEITARVRPINKQLNRQFHHTEQTLGGFLEETCHKLTRARRG